MTFTKRIAPLLLAFGLSLPVLAMDLSGAMTALPAAKVAGQLGEQTDGYLGVVQPGGQSAEVAKLINQARRAEYQKLATQNGIRLSDVEAMAGKKAVEKTPPGQFIRLDGQWRRK
ncbi:YdbL family protein [Pseudomonas sp. MAP12]|uniref:YdbL family protein n=1 Tax=Geopseudomonas aromaticivorans TaxID=2849492 RepID=A0ABS6N199_9GAMM|nr:YdbL family protein [Pseudomonas aromaticivorans]MBV2134833.1 YdbL family protein [Pseudomonas aromaticivorans]